MPPTAYGSGEVHEPGADHFARAERGSLATHSGDAKSWLSGLSADDELTPEPTPARFFMLGAGPAPSPAHPQHRLPRAPRQGTHISVASFPQVHISHSRVATHTSARDAGIFCCASFGSALGWLSYAPIADIAESHFDVGPGFINLIGNLFLILYVPGSILSLWVTEAHGLSANIVTGIWLSFFMCLIKWIATLVPDPHTGFALTVLGQVVGAAGQPLLLNVAARLSMDWCAQGAGCGRSSRSGPSLTGWLAPATSCPERRLLCRSLPQVSRARKGLRDNGCGARRTTARPRSTGSCQIHKPHRVAPAAHAHHLCSRENNHPHPASCHRRCRT